ncbi:uncharacterized protein PFL1_04822 [Pseudozyma flocculosa PF-1]|uniref:Related to AP-3 adapter complex mu3A subunit n=2 Tax=Pseudozyma flocculosa TaxID=84751 RepID=A0A5C3F3V1_9BASI|nr:uncharacterized protein PFL1_04822 [Pseudozyma flocculosa PF-1]EPQ27684.1 hypothetical protein PFL1_04822 [Pseudozyma flocculosa PF-1]SPO39183.1 related to AP-3 adapter complex mu3A subunit [Pseudozyma flocculosa]
MGRLEGIIILSADGRPIVHSHFANAVAAYPLLHTDFLNTLLSSIAAANAQLSSAASTSSSLGAGSGSGSGNGAAAKQLHPSRITSVKDIKPVLWVPGIPYASHLHDDDDEEDDEDVEDDDDDDDDDDDSDGQGQASTSYASNGHQGGPRALTGGSDVEGANIWSDSVRPAAPTASDSEPGSVSRPTPDARAAKVLSHANEALAEQGAALCHIQSGNLRFLCPVSSEVDPLVPLAFLHAFVAILQEYLAQSTDPSALTEDLIRDHFDIVYQLFEEILDKDGNVLTTEVNSLKSLVLPPSWVDKIVKAVGVSGLASAAPPPMVSPIPWRRTHTKYTNNEFYVDLVESLEGIVDRSGRPVALDLWASLDCNSKLSGTPELTLAFNTPTLVQDVSFHPCVRYRKWTKEKVLSFIPPDGTFELASFRVGAPHAVPLPPSRTDAPLPSISSPCNGWAKSVPFRLETSFVPEAPTKGSGTTTTAFSIQISSLLPPAQSLEDVEVTFGLGAGTQSVAASVGSGTASANSVSAVSGGSLGAARGGGGGGGSASTTETQAGTFIFDQKEKVLRWRIPRVGSESRPPLLKGSWLSCDTPPRPTALQVSFSIPVHSLSGLKVTSLQILNEAYRPFKGVRSMAKGRIQWRI